MEMMIGLTSPLLRRRRLQIAFSFTFAGVAYSGLRIYSNGMLTFGTDNSGFWRTYSNAALPVTSVSNYSSSCPGIAPARIIAAYWTDIVAGTRQWHQRGIDSIRTFGQCA
jgi:hypothetical protein